VVFVVRYPGKGRNSNLPPGALRTENAECPVLAERTEPLRSDRREARDLELAAVEADFADKAGLFGKEDARHGMPSFSRSARVRINEEVLLNGEGR